MTIRDLNLPTTIFFKEWIRFKHDSFLFLIFQIQFRKLLFQHKQIQTSLLNIFCHYFFDHSVILKTFVYKINSLKRYLSKSLMLSPGSPLITFSMASTQSLVFLWVNVFIQRDREKLEIKMEFFTPVWRMPELQAKSERIKENLFNFKCFQDKMFHATELLLFFKNIF